MPVEFDPRWEYWQPSGEVAEALADIAANSARAGGVGGWSDIGLFPEDNTDTSGRAISPGFRFGSGNPDGWLPLRLAQERRDCRVGEAVPCQQCGTRFYRGKTRASRLRCHGCRQRNLETRKGRPSKNPVLPCDGCGVPFQTSSQRRRFCSWACRRKPKVTTGLGAPRRIPDDVVARFQPLYESGMKLDDIAAELGISVITVLRWRNRMGLPRRPAVAMSQRACAACGALYQPEKAKRKYCGVACIPRPGRTAKHQEARR